MPRYLLSFTPDMAYSQIKIVTFPVASNSCVHRLPGTFSCPVELSVVREPHGTILRRFLLNSLVQTLLLLSPFAPWAISRLKNRGRKIGKFATRMTMAHSSGSHVRKLSKDAGLMTITTSLVISIAVMKSANANMAITAIFCDSRILRRTTIDKGIDMALSVRCIRFRLTQKIS